MRDILNFIIDVGVGAIALRLTMQLKIVVTSLKDISASHEVQLQDHEKRISGLEKPDTV